MQRQRILSGDGGDGAAQRVGSLHAAARAADPLAHPLARRAQCDRGRAIFTAVIWDGAQVLTAGPQRAAADARFRPAAAHCWKAETGRLQSLIHRYFTQPNADS